MFQSTPATERNSVRALTPARNQIIRLKGALSKLRLFSMKPGKLTATRFLALSLLSMLGLFSAPTQADSRQDHEVARRALAAGEILPLRTVLERLESTHPGEVLEVELEQKNGRWIYEVKLLSRNSGINKLIIDAKDASLIETKNRRTSKNEIRHHGEAKP